MSKLEERGKGAIQGSKPTLLLLLQPRESLVRGKKEVKFEKYIFKNFDEKQQGDGQHPSN